MITRITGLLTQSPLIGWIGIKSTIREARELWSWTEYDPNGNCSARSASDINGSGCANGSGVPGRYEKNNMKRRYTINEQDNLSVIHIHGEIGQKSAPEVQRGLRKCVESGKDILVCMAQVPEVDTAGAATLVDAYTMAQDRGLQMALVSENPPVETLMGLYHLDSVIPTFSTPEAARTWLSDRRESSHL